MNRLPEIVSRTLNYSLKIEILMSKYDNPTLVQFNWWNQPSIRDIKKTYECTLINGSNTIIANNDTATVISLAHGDKIIRVYKLEYSVDA